MPELPEVETVRRQLARTWVGRRITAVDVAPPNYFFVTPPRVLKQKLLNRKALALNRHGKYLIAQLDDESSLLLHLGMTGQFVARALADDGHVHMVLHLSGKKVISLRDVRKFGKVEWIAPGSSSKRLQKLGPDALLTTTPHLRSEFARRNIAIKTALLDQSVWAGVGNIYADEALFATKILPTTAARSLSPRKVDQLRAEVQAVLERAIAAGGSTINDYLQPDGELGGFQNWHQVYGKTGEHCPRCPGTITRIVLGGRSTHFCPRCQR